MSLARSAHEYLSDLLEALAGLGARNKQTLRARLVTVA